MSRRNRLLRLFLGVFMAAFAATVAWAQLPAPGDKILSFEELKQCMLAKKRNDETAQQIKRDQEAFAREHDLLKKEQAQITQTKEELIQESKQLAAERAAIDARTAELEQMAAAAKTDEEKARYTAELKIHIERGDKHDAKRAAFRDKQMGFNEKVNAFNAKANAVNARGQEVNARVAPLQKAHEEWRAACGNRRYREEDEKDLKQELNL